ncbi:TRAP transporter large permease [Arthrobacter sulfonylureivorans]|uniref:TRAP transporter large permease n=1 Tax=Arthrobacter sulfonylureivorans TaxID=2486855 RepID=A0ABY3W995_9MICC|nr:TRAP transporter large permease [Arthrobacter sulfonylureivorans]UNK46919.1 TRAP transporter large permease [Arthrobacter sulfonylureivorans]
MKTPTMQARVPVLDEVPVGPRSSRIGPLLFAITGALSVIIIVLLLAFPLTREATGLLVILLTVILLLTGIPIAFAMSLSALLGLWKLGGWVMVDATFTENVFSSTASWSLSVLPMFILMGIALWRSGLTTGAYEAARQWLGKLPGGLAVGTNFAGAGLAAASGSTVGISYALGRVAIPEMMKAGYKPSLATGTVAMAGTLGQLIPPSIMLVIYAGVVQTPVGPQLIAAVVPGLIIMLAFAGLIVVRAALDPALAPRADLSDVTWPSRWKSVLSTLPVLVVVLIVIGGLFAGVFTPSEAGAFGALGAILLGWLFGGNHARSPKGLATFVMLSLKDAVIATAAIFLLMIAVNLLTRVLALSRVPHALTELVVDMGLDRIQFLLILVIVFLILGMFLDPLAMILLTVPVLVPPLLALEVDMLWFGVFIVILAEIGIVTPPIGILTFIVHRLAQDANVNLGVPISLTDVFKGVLWFVGAALLVLVALIFLPELVTWLPELSAQRP